jgi:hypothetical protein
MGALATIADLEALRGRTLSGDSAREVRINRLLEMSSASVRNYCDQYFEFVEDDIVTVEPDEIGRYRLHERPVIAVTSVTDQNATVLDPANYRVDADGFLLQASAWPRRVHLYGTGPLEVVYTHGYEIIPADIVMVTCSAANRQLVNPRQIRSESVGDYAVGYTIPGTGMATGINLAEPEMRTLRTYRWEAT